MNFLNAIDISFINSSTVTILEASNFDKTEAKVDI